MHRLVGYAAVAVVLIRLTWSVVPRGQRVRLRPSISDTLLYVRRLLSGSAPRSRGHNPLGLWMVWLMWLLVVALGVTGWMSRLDMFWGDEIVEDAHALLADMLMVAAVVHVLAVCAMSLIWKENLPAAMVTGIKRAVE